MSWTLWLVLSCARVPPAAAPAETVEALPEVAADPGAEPETGWYDGACYAALDGDVDTALGYLARAVELGDAPLEWMGNDPDLESVRADPRYVTTRDDAIDLWVEAHPPSTGHDWMQVARSRVVQGRDPTEALVAADAAGYPHALFDPELPAVTPALEALQQRREAWIEARRGTVTVEIPRTMELAKIVLSQTAYGQTPNATDRSTTYATEVDAWFSPYRDHPLIRELDALPVDMDVYYGFRNQAAAWELVDGALVPGGVYAVGGMWGRDPFAERIELVEDFVATTDAEAFLDAHEALYASRIAAYEEAVPIREMWDWLEAHFQAEDDGRDALVVRSSLLIGGSHNATTLTIGNFTEGGMVAPLFIDGDELGASDLGPLARTVFTEIDHHYVNPVSNRMRSRIDEALGDYRAFNIKADDWGYASPYLTFNEYATWVLFDVWWSEHCDAVVCSPEQRAAGEQDTVRVMKRRGFHRYTEFREAMLPQLRGQADLEAMFPVMLDWFREQSISTR